MLDFPQLNSEENEISDLKNLTFSENTVGGLGITNSLSTQSPYIFEDFSTLHILSIISAVVSALITLLPHNWTRLFFRVSSGRLGMRFSVGTSPGKNQEGLSLNPE